MAQMARQRRHLAQRFGLRGSGAVGLALVTLTLVLGCLGLGWSYMSQAGFEHISSSHKGELETELETSGEEVSKAEGELEGDEVSLPSELYVHVDGAVANPGVYVLSGESPRVGQAVELAGGLTEDADTLSVNLAAPLTDGEKVYIPHAGEEGEQAVVSDPVSGVPSGGAAQDTSSTVDINTATAEELQSLPGVGEATARAIIEERERGGPFTSIEDIMRVSGIGEKKFERMRERIRV